MATKGTQVAHDDEEQKSDQAMVGEGQIATGQKSLKMLINPERISSELKQSNEQPGSSTKVEKNSLCYYTPQSLNDKMGDDRPSQEEAAK